LELVNYKLILLVKSFSPKEIEQFEKFISSPYFTKGRNYIPFLKEVIRLISASEHKNTGMKTSDSDTGKKLSDQTLRNRYSELYKLGEEFLIYNSLSKNKIEKEKILLNELVDKKLFVPFSIKYREALKYLNSDKFDNNKYRNISVITELNSRFLLEKNKIEQVYSEFYRNSEIILCLNLINFFELGYEFAQQEFDGRKFEPNYILDFLRRIDIEDVMEAFRKKDSIIFKVTSLNYYLYMAFRNEDNEDYYFKSHKIFSGLFAELKDSYKVKIFNYMINYCIRKQNRGIKKYQFELFNLYNEKLDQNLISDIKTNAYVFNFFRDYVHIGISIKEFEWVENFISKYSHELPREMRDDETKLSYAKLDLAKRRYERSLSNLNNIKTTYYLLYTDSSLIRLCNFFELKKYEEAYLELDRLKHYMRNHKEIPSDYKHTTENFIKVYNKILKHQTDPVRDEIGFLEKDVMTLKMIAKRDWLIEKIGELRN